MPIVSMTYEKVASLQAKVAKANAEFKVLSGRSPKDFWEQDLDKFLEVLTEVETKEMRAMAAANKMKAKSALQYWRGSGASKCGGEGTRTN